MHEIIMTLVDAEIPVTLKRHGGGVSYEVPGFYRSGTVLLMHNAETGGLVARDGDGDIIRIDSLKDLVLLNYDWWMQSRSRHEDYTSPDHQWAKLLVQHGLVEVEEKVVRSYIPKR
jgi:hypothetical protein